MTTRELLQEYANHCGEHARSAELFLKMFLSLAEKSGARTQNRTSGACSLADFADLLERLEDRLGSSGGGWTPATARDLLQRLGIPVLIPSVELETVAVSSLVLEAVRAFCTPTAGA